MAGWKFDWVCFSGDKEDFEYNLAKINIVS
jgi:hypothetical protein